MTIDRSRTYAVNFSLAVSLDPDFVLPEECTQRFKEILAENAIDVINASDAKDIAGLLLTDFKLIEDLNFARAGDKNLEFTVVGGYESALGTAFLLLEFRNLFSRHPFHLFKVEDDLISYVGKSPALLAERCKNALPGDTFCYRNSKLRKLRQQEIDALFSGRAMMTPDDFFLP